MGEVQQFDTGQLPATSDIQQWSDRERALAEAMGLVIHHRGGDVEVADRGTIEVFLGRCRDTRLNPIAKQIYCVKYGGKWETQLSVDGMRILADRTGEYEGQTPVQWSGDGVTWVDAWAPDEPPMFARVGVYRRGWRDAQYTTVKFKSFAVTRDEWVGGKPTGRKLLNPMWLKMPEHMLANAAEKAALRKTFSAAISGIETEQAVSSEASSGVGWTVQSVVEPEGAVAETVTEPEEVEVAVEVVEPDVDPDPAVGEIVAAADAANDVAVLRGLWQQASSKGLLSADYGGVALNDYLLGRKAQLDAAVEQGG